MIDDTKELILLEAGSYFIRQEVIDRANYMISSVIGTFMEALAESEFYKSAFEYIMIKKGYGKDLV